MCNAFRILDAFLLGANLFLVAAADPHSTRARFLGKSHHGSVLRSDVQTQLELSYFTPVDGVLQLFQKHSAIVADDVQHKSHDTIGIEANVDALFIKRIRNGIARFVFGIIFFVLAIPLQWYNEERSARMEILLRRGLSECVSISPEEVSQEHHGRLVHLQGWARAAVPLTDHQFLNAEMTKCLKLQSTLEVFEWIPTTRTLLDGKWKRKQPHFHTEWTTNHQGLQRFKGPSPENPKLPSGIILGTFTQVCSRIEVGAFVVTKEMVESFVNYDPAMKHLPQTLYANGFAFFANPEDGYYYMRPGITALDPSGPNLLTKHQVGDVRARFMCVPESEVTVVAVQRQADHEAAGTFVPYRPISHCYITDDQVREKCIEEGGRPLIDFKADVGCRPSCVCCACNAVALCCQSEKVTEEIFYTSNKHVPKEHPFEKMVPRNPCRVWLFRLIGWGLMYLGIAMVLSPFAGAIEHAPGLIAYGSAAAFILAAIITLSTAGFIMALAYGWYQPIMILKWLLFIVLIIAAPLLWGGLSPYAKTIGLTP